MQDKELLNEALDFIVGREQDNDYICEMPRTDNEVDYWIEIPEFLK